MTSVEQVMTYTKRDSESLDTECIGFPQIIMATRRKYHISRCVIELLTRGTSSTEENQS